MTQLNKVPVLFNQEEHTYTNTVTGKVLQGITSTLIHRLFPDKYKDIPQHILDAAAARGSNVHEDIELSETLGVTPTTIEGRNYRKLKERYGLKFLESEFTVSDLEHYASQIDLIFDVEENVIDIADIKTTSRFDRESVSWQLSIYAYLIRLNNPHIKVRNLFGIWLRGDIAEVIEVDRHSDDEIKALIECDLNDCDYDYSPAFPSYITENENVLISLSQRIKELTEEYEAVKGEVLQKMTENNDKSFDTGRLLITLVAPSTRKTFDSKAYQKDHPDEYDKYVKESQTKESLKITVR